MAKIVIYYSRGDENYFGGQIRTIDVGNTEKIARSIAKYTGAELFKIEQTEPYAAEYNVCVQQARADLQAKTRPSLLHWIEDLDAYDEIYLGFPNYWGTMPMAVFTFVERFDWEGKVVHPFVTHEGSGFGNSLVDLKTVCAGAKIEKGLAITGSSVDGAEALVQKWSACPTESILITGGKKNI